jgi:hypothetical protein
MSVAAMNWVWRQQLAPTPKLVLMSLGDAADDRGVCWPSVSTVASKCCISTRTVRRIMRELETMGKIRRDPRFRKDGSQSSNCYLLALDGGDKLSGATAVGDDTPGKGCQVPGDTAVTPGTTREPSRKSPPLQSQAVGRTAPVMEKSGDSGDRQAHELEYPASLTAAERAAARKQLAAFPLELAQQLLDELTGRMEAGAIRVAPLAYLRGLSDRARRGTFVPEAAIRVSDRRTRRRRNEMASQHAEVTFTMSPMDAGQARDIPVLRRLDAIKRRALGSGGDAE